MAKGGYGEYILFVGEYEDPPITLFSHLHRRLSRLGINVALIPTMMPIEDLCSHGFHIVSPAYLKLRVKWFYKNRGIAGIVAGLLLTPEHAKALAPLKVPVIFILDERLLTEECIEMVIRQAEVLGDKILFFMLLSDTPGLGWQVDLSKRAPVYILHDRRASFALRLHLGVQTRVTINTPEKLVISTLLPRVQNSL